MKSLRNLASWVNVQLFIAAFLFVCSATAFATGDPTTVTVPDMNIDASSLSTSITSQLNGPMVGVLAITGLLVVFRLTRKWFRSA